MNELVSLERGSQIKHSYHITKGSDKYSYQGSTVNLAIRALPAFPKSLKGVVTQNSAGLHRRFPRFSSILLLNIGLAQPLQAS